MCTSGSHLPISLPSKFRFLFQHRLNSYSHPVIIKPISHFGFSSHSRSISALVAKKDFEFSWVSWDQNGPDYYNGWAVIEAPIKHNPKRKGAALVLICTGASVAAFLGVVAFFLLSNKGLKFLSGSFKTLQGNSFLSETKGNEIAVEPFKSDVLKDKSELCEESQEGVSDTANQDVLKDLKNSFPRHQQFGKIRAPFAVDSTQQEALLTLKKLKIIENDVIGDELCTRREFARWLVRANSQFERSQRNQIVSSAALSGSTVAAFDDVKVEDPDFLYIQCLAEAGIVASKLLDGNIWSDSNDSEGVYFFPQRFISRQDLISWKAKLEYGITQGINEGISRTNIQFLDSRDVSSEASVDLFMDILADERSILRRVFGQIRRLQPRKPSTKAQVAVALTSGRMAGFIQVELSRLETESASRQTAMQEIKAELLERGDIQRFWEGKMEEARYHGLEVEKTYLAAIHDLELEKAIQENSLTELLKQKAALDCQKQLLSSLKQEVHEMSAHLELERAKYMDERSSIESELRDLRVKYGGLLDAKSILEAEIEALRILRSWVDDEARKSQARAKVLGEVGKRWKWEKRS